jgi:hypothetical protein
MNIISNLKYPIKTEISGFDLPWHCHGGWKNWFIYDWKNEDKKNKSVWIGRRFFGFKKIVIIWTCSKKEAEKQNTVELIRLIDSLRKEMKNCVI